MTATTPPKPPAAPDAVPTPAPRPSNWLSRAIQIVVGIVVTVACFWWAGGSVWKDPVARTQLITAFQTADYRIVPVMWGLLALFYWIKAWRWQLLLGPLGHYRTTRDCLPPILIGFAFNNVLPAHLGEFVRIFVFARKHTLAKSSVFSTVALERVLDILAILAFLGTGLFLVEGVSERTRSVAVTVGGVAILGFFGALAFVVFTKPVVQLAEGILRRLPFIPHGLQGKILALIEAGAAGLASLKNPWTLVGLMLTSLAQWGLNGLLIHLSLRSFGVEVPPQVSLVVLGVVAFGVTVPSTPGYFGVIQACFAAVLDPFPVSRPAVFAASIFYQLVQWVPVTGTGIPLFVLSGVRLRDVQGAKEHADPTHPALSGSAPLPESDC